MLIYSTVIAASPGRVWNALIDPARTAHYWGHHNVSTWTPGEPWEHRRVSDGGLDVVGEVLEFDPPRRLAHTWARPEREGESRVTFDVEPVPGGVRLTVTHDGVPDDQVAVVAIGWPFVLSSLVSYVETGRAA
ncbi:SRPBCC family protein [Cryptosporangium phraense]|uniref:Polyketide cyclase n=1 Tax=Cryptosporangium phraense TaxID=2593070 RepID=A0A545AT57_9ACTN|nr:SRPBCC family protein [Cryptosporangium phraense]TQS44431.1 polyketide cyclase [Cryptosporangium phraense]